MVFGYFCKRVETQNKSLVNQNSVAFHLTSNAKGEKIVNCNTHLMEVFPKKMLVLGKDNISSEVALQFQKKKT